MGWLWKLRCKLKGRHSFVPVLLSSFSEDEHWLCLCGATATSTWSDKLRKRINRRIHEE